jgi:hypothetical protein
MTGARDDGSRVSAPAPASERDARPPPATREFHVRIERLTLAGYTREEQQRFTRALESALLRLHAAPERLPLSSREIAALEPMRLPAGVPVERAAELLVDRLLRRIQRDSPERTHV